MAIPTWFLVFLAICAAWAFLMVLRGIKNNGVYVGDIRVGRITTILASIIILIALALFAAILLGFVPDHAP